MLQVKDKRRYTRLSVSEWDSIISLYETGASTLSEIAERYKISVGAIMAQARLRGVRKRGKFSPAAGLSAVTVAVAPVSAALKAPARSDPAALAKERVEATNLDAYSDAVAIQYVIRAAIAALPAPTTPQEAAATVRAADMAVSALKRCNEIRRTVLRLDTICADADVLLPELPITELTDAEVQQMRADQAREDAGFELELTFDHSDEGIVTEGI